MGRRKMPPTRVSEDAEVLGDVAPVGGARSASTGRVKAVTVADASELGGEEVKN